MNDKSISETTLRRLPIYLHYLNSIKGKRKNVSAAIIAASFGLNDVQVRKDLGVVSGTGRPKTGYDTEELISQIEDCLGYRNETKTILVGAGNLGKALLSYNGFKDYGLDIIAAFDINPAIVGITVNGKPVLPLTDIEKICFEKNIKLGIITTPVEFAQSTCERLVSYGIRAIWNFSPTILRAPENVLIENENLASSLALLSKHLSEIDQEVKE
jgi:redox-sensing transcriptional repressor